MKHIHIDEFAKLNSPLHKLDPRAKAVAVFIFIFVTATINKPPVLLTAISFWAVMLFIGCIPLAYVIKRITWIFPFAGFLILLFPFITPGETIWTGKLGVLEITATAQGLDRAVMLMLRVLASVLGLITLMATTRFHILLKALGDLKVPGVILQMVEFTLRYLFVTVDELKRMRRARKSRGFTLGKNIWHKHTLKTLSQMVGVMLLRAYERGDRVYIAMISRGFTGKANVISDYSISVRDYVISGGILAVAILLLVIDKGGFIG